MPKQVTISDDILIRIERLKETGDLPKYLKNIDLRVNWLLDIITAEKLKDYTFDRSDFTDGT